MNMATAQVIDTNGPMGFDPSLAAEGGFLELLDGVRTIVKKARYVINDIGFDGTTKLEFPNIAAQLTLGVPEREDQVQLFSLGSKSLFDKGGPGTHRLCDKGGVPLDEDAHESNYVRGPYNKINKNSKFNLLMAGLLAAGLPQDELNKAGGDISFLENYAITWGVEQRELEDRQTKQSKKYQVLVVSYIEKIGAAEKAGTSTAQTEAPKRGRPAGAKTQAAATATQAPTAATAGVNGDDAVFALAGPVVAGLLNDTEGGSIPRNKLIVSVGKVDDKWLADREITLPAGMTLPQWKTRFMIASRKEGFGEALSEASGNQVACDDETVLLV